MSTTTPNLGLTLPTPNVDTGWGSTLNTDFTLLDNIFANNGSGTAVGINVGSGKTLNAGGTIVAGGTLILGSGDGTSTVTAPTIRGAAKTGTNAVGDNLVIDALNGTGTGGSGKIIFRTAPASGTPGPAANTMASVFEVNSAGAIGVAGASYGTTKQALLSNGSAAAPNWGDVDGTVLKIPSQAQGDILYNNGTAWARLPAGTANQVLKTQGAAANPAWGDYLTRATAQNIASGGVSFTGIPSWVKQITMVFNGLTFASPSITPLVRLGTSSGYATTGYSSSGSFFRVDTGSGGSGGTTSSTSGFCTYPLDAYTFYGTMVITNISGNIWIANHTMGTGDVYTLFGGGKVTLSGTLDRIQVVPSTSSFTASGSVNILYA